MASTARARLCCEHSSSLYPSVPIRSQPDLEARTEPAKETRASQGATSDAIWTRSTCVFALGVRARLRSRLGSRRLVSARTRVLYRICASHPRAAGQLAGPRERRGAVGASKTRLQAVVAQVASLTSVTRVECASDIIERFAVESPPESTRTRIMILFFVAIR